MEALDQIVASLPEGLSFEQAVACLNDLPLAIEQHPGMARVRSTIVGVLVKGIEEREGKAGKEQELEAGAGARAKHLGPVAGMFEGGGDDAGDCHHSPA